MGLRTILDELASVLPTKRPLPSFKNDAATETAHCFPLSEIEEATRKFEKKIGSGGFGIVYYGKLKDGKEIAVKVLTNNSFQGRREFSNEVTCRLLSNLIHFDLTTNTGTRFQQVHAQTDIISYSKTILHSCILNICSLVRPC